MADTQSSPRPPAPQRRHHHVEPLWWIGAYKLLKAALAVAGGLIMLRLMHVNLPEATLRWMTRLGIDDESRAGRYLLTHVILLRPSRLLWVAIALFVYTPVLIAEGIGLMRKKYWAEWLTVVTTFALIPFEVHHFVRRPTAVRIAILLLNIAVVIYLIYRIRRDRLRRERAANGAAGSYRLPMTPAADQNRPGDDPERRQA